MKRYIYSDRDHRILKAKTIWAILSESADFTNSAMLEVGTGAGVMSQFFSERVQSVVSIDVVDERIEQDGYEFHQVDSAKIPFEDGSFDLVISNQVIEHVPAQKQHVAEIFRVLKPGGIAYFSTPNRFWIREVHSRLYFLGYFPRPIASAIYTFFRKGEWDVFPLSYCSLKRLIKQHFYECHDFGGKLISRPERYSYEKYGNLLRRIKWVPSFVTDRLTWIFPCFFLVAKKSG